MKKIISIALIIIIFISMTKGDSITIPNEALRFRVIANSNEELDQQIKNNVRHNVEQNIYQYLKSVNNIDNAKEIINNNIEEINKSVETTLLNYNNPYKYNVNLGLNYFPSKEYKGIIYEEGKYESLVITLGNGEGDNWWCILFPPLCLIEAEENELDEVEYKSFVKELIDKFMK